MGTRATLPPAEPVPSSAAVALARIGRVVLAEARLRTSRRLPGRWRASLCAVPRTPAELTPDWLTGALCRDVARARVASVALRGSSSGTTTRAAVDVTYNRAGTAAGLPQHLFVKCTSSLPQRLMLGMGGLITGEPGFYERIRPRLDIEAPAGYFGTVDPSSWRSVVVIENVAITHGARFGSARSLSRAQIEELLASAARWHGSLWADPKLDGAWTWLRTPAEQARLIVALIGMADRTHAGARRAATVLPPALRERQRDLFEGMRRSLALLGEPPHTYLHGDLHLGNTYRTRSGRMGVCDWQVGLRGGWAHDVAYLLITALEVGDRRAWERELLGFYLQRLGEAGGAPPIYEAAWLAYRRATLYPYFAWIYTLGRSRLQPRFQQPQLALRLVQRIGAAIEDLGSLRAVGL
ncbi:MAG TPA: phosphotransferase [Solirubrobacteraceae bacterium]|nr:phosphotransferase [Solirubrobacteraceae bacterium]